jgi:Protein of unknown function (DUF1566)
MRGGLIAQGDALTLSYTFAVVAPLSFAAAAACASAGQMEVAGVLAVIGAAAMCGKALDELPQPDEDSRTAAAAELKPGDHMPDGTVYAGISPDTHKPMYTTPTDAPLTYTFNQARRYAAKLDAHGHADWRIPSKRELNVLFNNGAAIGGCEEPGSWYWSSLGGICHDAWAQRFSDGRQGYCFLSHEYSLRCVL